MCIQLASAAPALFGFARSARVQCGLEGLVFHRDARHGSLRILITTRGFQLRELVAHSNIVKDLRVDVLTARIDPKLFSM